jgi:two-component system LytT family response regulator
MKRAVIIDDEALSVDTMRLLINEYIPQLRIVGVATDPESGIELIENFRPDIVFLDISMPKMTGFELLEKTKFRDFKLVFCTAHREHAIRAIKNKAQDYLLKPIDYEELLQCVQSIFEEEKKSPEKKNKSQLLELHVKDGIIFIKQEDIIRLEASGSYTTYYLENSVKHMASKNLKECEKFLDPDLFYRCHPSHIINLKKVVRMVTTDGLFAKMVDNSSPEIVRKNKDIFLQRLKDL